MGFYAFLTTYTTHPSVTNFLCKDLPAYMMKFSHTFFGQKIFPSLFYII